MTLIVPRFRRRLLAPLALALILPIAACQHFAGIRYDAPPDTGLYSYVAGQAAWAEQDTVRAADHYLEVLAADPDNPLLRQRAFQLLLGDGRFRQALAVGRDLAPGSAAYGVARMMVALGQLRARHYDAALSALDEGNGTGFDPLLKPISRAWILMAQGKTEAALDQLGGLAGNPALSAFGDEHRGLILAVSGSWDSARPLLAELIAREKAGSRTVIDFAARLAAAGDVEAARAVLAPWTENNPQMIGIHEAQATLDAGGRLAPLINDAADGVAEAMYRTATELMRQPTAQSAIVYARLATFLKPDFAEAYMLIGDLLDVQGRNEAAIDAYRMVASDSPLHPHAVLREAYMLNRIDQGAAALALLDRLLATRPDLVEARIARADMLRQAERFEAAAAEYGRLIDGLASPQSADWTLFYGRGIAYERQGMWQRAEDDFEAALKLKPNEPYVLNYLGYSWLDRGVNLPEATRMVERAVAERPNDGFIIDSLGWAYYLGGEYESAVQILERAVSLQPGDPTINEHLGDAYWKAGRTIEARFKWRHALQLDPADKDRARVAQKLDLGLSLVEGTK